MTPFLIGIWFFCAFYAAQVCFLFWTVYVTCYRPKCSSDNNQCLRNYLINTSHPPLKLWVYSSSSPSAIGSDLYLVWELNGFNPNESFTKEATVGIPLGVYNKGTMYVHVFLAPTEGGRGEKNPFEADWMVYRTGILTTTHTVHQAIALKNISENNKPEDAEQLTAGWRPLLTLNVVTEYVNIDNKSIPESLTDYIRQHEDEYLPILVIDEMSNRTKDLLPLKKTCKEMPLTVNYSPISFAKFSLRKILQDEINRGIPVMETDDLKEAFIVNLQGLAVQSILYVTYVLLVFWAYESDIRFWQDRQTMSGLSTQTVVWRSVCVVASFLLLIDERRNIYAIIGIGILSMIEIWKVLRVFRARISCTEWRLVIDNVAAAGNKELETQALDAQAMGYLSWVLYPSWVAVIIYTLVYNFQKSWCSLFLLSLFNGFYYFGFLFMLPQVFINYKLKSVADLPWMTLMFRAITAVIKDISQFILMMPIDDPGLWFTDHVIFVIYVYQRWLY